MEDGMHQVWILTKDEALMASAEAAVDEAPGWETCRIEEPDLLLAETELEAPASASTSGIAAASGGLLLLDAWTPGHNVYELARRLTGRTRCRMYVVVDLNNETAEPIARFCGAAGVMRRPLSKADIQQAIAACAAPTSPLPAERRSGQASFDLPQALLTDIQTGAPDRTLVSALVDPTTGLFNYAFLNFKLDEEFKRARRFVTPLACVMLGFEGQADDAVLRELAGIFLASSRDTDVLGRFDESSFLFLLPHTGPDGARIMAERVTQAVAERGLSDLVGDSLTLSVGITLYPAPNMDRREELYTAARQAFVDARSMGGGVVVTP